MARIMAAQEWQAALVSLRTLREGLRARLRCCS